MGQPQRQQASISQHIQHFMRSSGESVHSALAALAGGDFSAFRAILSKVESLDVTKAVAVRITTSSTDAEALLNKASISTGLTFFAGMVSIGWGGCLLAELAAGTALVAGSAVITGIVAIALLLIGISLAFPSLWKSIKERFDMDRLLEQRELME